MVIGQLPAPAETVDGQWYRQVLGQYPTGVCLVTSDSDTEGPAGMIIGSFTSVSLDPPLVAFYPAKTSTTWPKIERSGAFCVNILGAGQEALCRHFGSKEADKFGSLAYRPAEKTGSPILDDVVAWMDCTIELVQEAGDHYLVMGRIQELRLEKPSLPMVFFQGGYGHFSSLSLTAPDERGSFTEPLRRVDLIRPALEKLVSDFECRCVAAALADDQIVIVASAGQSYDDDVDTTLVGQRLPLLPPSGSAFAAWGSPVAVNQWLRLAPESARSRYADALGLVRERGYSLGLISPAQREFASTLEAMAASPKQARQNSLVGIIPELDYDPPTLDEDTMRRVRQIVVPVFDPDGELALALTAYGWAKDVGLGELVAALLDTASAATRRIGGRQPGRPA